MGEGLFEVGSSGHGTPEHGAGREPRRRAADPAPPSRSAESYFHPGAHAPLAVRMRPRTLDEVVGQEQVLGEGAPLRRLIEGRGESSVILYGPPGTGKTTVASLIAGTSGHRFEALSALNSGVKEVRAVIDTARRMLVDGVSTVLFIDEVHRFSRTQQDALLSAVENRTVLLVAATTENPSFSVVAPLLSRSLLVQLTPLAPADIATLLRRAVDDPRGFGGSVTLTDEACDRLTALAAGDARRALTYLEAAAETVQDSGGEITVETVALSTDRAVARYDRDGDQHYDIVSAFIKSIRGSDPDAALHYLARMIDAGEDPRFIARRLVIHASEDIGMADPTALQIAVAAHQAVSFIGMPEGRIPLAQATVHLATAAKSNSVISAVDAALADVRAGKGTVVPPHLRDGHYSGAEGLGNAVGYRYPHDDPRGVLAQDYLPEDLAGARYYEPTDHGRERQISATLDTLRSIVRDGR
ncbi:replication-associated recombination protein A [Corynebacterium provencense]|uniref:Putative AAA domain-containing protein n=1 Tax=Corynebacterium provencense TaxID=1737425 RepID=A0A2Z3YVM8_9CORY|nr:replication-associated recombination protein A [Corynebacterium provencense]AWT26127.1 putative AAA domain-containing protein [Corynebacterium provencense]MCI1256848.1 replication-associated recombination protein A [Corynebacterium provencense]